MSESDSEPAPDSAAVLQSMSLLATLSAAAEVREGIAERRAGRDPSAQAPPALATARLHAAGDDLMDLLMQLVLGRVPEREDEGPLAHATRQFDLLMTLRRAERHTQAMHQHLLSLYPDVSEALVEEARAVHRQLEDVLGTDPSDPDAPALPDVVERGIALVMWTRHEV